MQLQPSARRYRYLFIELCLHLDVFFPAFFTENCNLFLQSVLIIYRQGIYCYKIISVVWIWDTSWMIDQDFYVNWLHAGQLTASLKPFSQSMVSLEFVSFLSESSFFLRPCVHNASSTNLFTPSDFNFTGTLTRPLVYPYFEGFLSYQWLSQFLLKEITGLSVMQNSNTIFSLIFLILPS